MFSWTILASQADLVAQLGEVDLPPVHQELTGWCEGWTMVLSMLQVGQVPGESLHC
jgi:hypothetical protein